MKILLYGNPFLRKKAQKVKKIDKNIETLIEEMFKVMRESNPRGVGLAAIQVGVPLSLFVYELDENDKGVVINPEILLRSGSDVDEEGCLSLPGVYGAVERAGEIVVRALDMKGRKVEYHLTGLKARVFQHEIDHLRGVVFTDYIDKIDQLSVDEGFELPEALLEKFRVR